MQECTVVIKIKYEFTDMLSYPEDPLVALSDMGVYSGALEIVILSSRNLQH